MTRSRAASVCLGVAMLASAALLVAFDWQLGFVADDWELLVNRDGWAVAEVLDPFAEHPVIAAAIFYKVWVSLFGMSSAMPFYAVTIILFEVCALLLFVYIRPRVGDWAALLGTVLVLFLGAAFEDLFWVFSVSFFGSMAAGLGMLLALDRHDSKGDWIACGLLVVSLSFNGLGLVFAAGALVDVAMGRQPRAKRAFVALVPLALFALWWLGWGHQAESNLSLDNLQQLPSYVYDAAAAGIVSLLGRSSTPLPGWAPIPLLLAAALVGFRLYRERRISAGLAIALTLAFGFWVLAGLNRSELRSATTSRYQFISAIFLILIAAESLRGVRLPRAANLAAAAVAGVAVIGGVSLMQREFDDRWRPAVDETRARLAGVEIAGDAARPGYPIDFPPFVTIPAGVYLDAVRRHGSPAFDESELLRRPSPQLVEADQTLVRALGLALTPLPGSHDQAGCRTVRASRPGTAGVRLPRSGAVLANGTKRRVAVRLGRFAHLPSVSIGTLAPGGTRELSVPADGSGRSWRLGLDGRGAVRLCPISS